MQADELCRIAVSALEDIKARDIVVLDVRTMTSLFDYVIVASADSVRQTKSLARHVLEKARLSDVIPIGTEGEGTGEWVLVDLGDIVVHVMQPAVRDYYNLEELWGGHRQVHARPPFATTTATPLEAGA